MSCTKNIQNDALDIFSTIFDEYIFKSVLTTNPKKPYAISITPIDIPPQNTIFISFLSRHNKYVAPKLIIKPMNKAIK